MVQIVHTLVSVPSQALASLLLSIGELNYMLEELKQRFSAFTGFGLSATSSGRFSAAVREGAGVSVPSQALASLLPGSVSGMQTDWSLSFSAFTGFGLSATVSEPVVRQITLLFQCLHRLWPLCYCCALHQRLRRGSGRGFSAFTGFGLSATYPRTIIGDD